MMISWFKNKSKARAASTEQTEAPEQFMDALTDDLLDQIVGGTATLSVCHPIGADPIV